MGREFDALGIFCAGVGAAKGLSSNVTEGFDTMESGKKALLQLRARVQTKLLAKALAGCVLAPIVLVGCAQPRPVPPPPPPLTLAQVRQMGFHDGMEAARQDVAHGRPPMPRRHPRFRNPPVPPEAVVDYRRAFRNGYRHFLHPVPPQAPPPPPGA